MNRFFVMGRKKVLGIATLTLGAIYTGGVLSGVLEHRENYLRALENSRNPFKSAEERQMWRRYAEDENSREFDLRVLNPLERIFWSSDPFQYASASNNDSSS